MILRFLAIVLIASWLSPVFGQNPNTAIEWLKEEKDTKTGPLKDIAPEKNILSSAIEKTPLQPINLNSIGIIPTKISGIDPDLWVKMNENDISYRLSSLPNLKFQAAQTYLKRILISETQPPVSAPESKNSGKIYLLAKLDKLIGMGALDEAETMVLQVPQIDPNLFKRWIRISFLTGRIRKLCETLMRNSGLTQNLSVRIICLKNLNDWDAAALTLSTASNLEMFDLNREKFLIHYLDPKLVETSELSTNSVQLNEIDYFIINSSSQISSVQTSELRYLYMVLKNSSEPKNKIQAAEELAIKKSINASSLFDIYRNTSIDGSIKFWRRIIATKNLDLTLQRNNNKSVNIAVTKAINEMFLGNLLTLFATEYADKLSAYSQNKNWNERNDKFALIFALNGQIPAKWKNYKAQDHYISMAISILRNEKINAKLVYDAVALVNPDFKTIISSKKLASNKSKKNEQKFNNKGLMILEALKKSSQGIDTKPEDLYSSLLIFLQVEEIELVKLILVEYLVHFSMLNIRD